MSSTQRSRASFVLLLLSVCALHVTGAPCSSIGAETLEISGDELPDTPKVSPSTKWKPLTNVLLCEVSSLRDQQFDEEFAEPKDNMSNYKHHRLGLPQIIEHDCSSSNFSKESCLLRIARGLQLHAVYLQFVEQEYSKPATVADIKFRTKALAGHVMEMMKNSKHVQELNSDARDKLLSALPTASSWERKITVHVLLRDYHKFLTQTFRALRHIELRDRKRTALKLNN
ncbi:hypothetical protein SKAU_G00407400 [Synaphobranchus kaupii]|uniref:Interleukin-6 n=1 Tax=Synaphobranchus kaupii TaxID=118154 RepID=A0A9Q1ICZ9_SYNKA|nr:hypothetical protein SKAU_G00407400 [Synaphobranchus kaupii]